MVVACVFLEWEVLVSTDEFIYLGYLTKSSAKVVLSYRCFMLKEFNALLSTILIYNCYMLHFIYI